MSEKKIIKHLLKEDKKAKSKSFFLKKKIGVFNSYLLKFIEKEFNKTKKDLRVCLHKNSKAKHHDMIILQQKKNFYMPHKHLNKGETYHIIKGKMGCVLFKDNGKIKFTCTLNKNDIFRVPINTFHTMVPLSKIVIYHESKVGPFLKKNDSIYFKFTKKVKDNIKQIKKIINPIWLKNLKNI